MIVYNWWTKEGNELELFDCSMNFFVILFAIYRNMWVFFLIIVNEIFVKDTCVVHMY
jgi:hypothetical protein